MTPHGPDANVFEHATTAELKPVKYDASGLAFMFETYKMLSLTKWAIDGEGGKCRQHDYYECWQGAEKRFDVSKFGSK
jgi:homogentisate 1,2-dioxygenase